MIYVGTDVAPAVWIEQLKPIKCPTEDFLNYILSYKSIQIQTFLALQRVSIEVEHKGR